VSGRTLVVGASQAGVELAAALRQFGDREPVTLLGAEPHVPYQRPPLSKAFLAGKADHPSLVLRKESFFTDLDIALVTGERVTGFEMSTDTPGSGRARTDRGRTIEFDRLALTVGARPRRLDVPGAGLAGVCYLRHVADAATLREELTNGGRVVVVGGGFIGLEVAAVARAMGRAVTVVEATERLLGRSVAPCVSEFYYDAHTRRGVDIRLAAAVVAIRGEQGRATAVELADGTRLPADVVVIGVGVVPRTELAHQLGLAVDGGIVVDPLARTSNSAIVAAGDCTVFPHPVSADGRIRLESVPHATGQARVAAGTLLGRIEAYPAVPWFWSDQFDLKLQIAGLADGYDELVVRGAGTEAISVLYYRGGRLIAINAVNRIADYFAVRKALTAGTSIPADRAADSSVALKDLLGQPSGVPSGPTGIATSRRR
jgi:3-phenylpropionate/trans-cinnamate dioxygenase ferredoxin reductase subunit